MRLTRAITHIRLADTNPGKLAQLDALADEYMSLCQQYVTAFCTDTAPDKYADAWLASPLSARWQRVVIQHAAGIAHSWRTNRDRAYANFLDNVAEHQSHSSSKRLHQPGVSGAHRFSKPSSSRLI